MEIHSSIEAAASEKLPSGGSRSGKSLAVLIIRIAAVAAAVAGFALYSLDYAVSVISLALFACILIVAVPKIVDILVGNGELNSYPRSASKRAWRNFLLICLGALALHIVTNLIGTLIFTKVDRYYSSKSFFEIWRGSWMKGNTDAGHYISIAENWYLKEGVSIKGYEKPHLLIVFLPMFPLFIRGFNLVFNNSFVSAQVINALATSLASGMVYMTFLPVIGNSRSKVGAFVSILLPGMIFMNSPMSEPLFLLFTVCAFFFMQRKQFLLSGIFVACAGFTRSLGVIAAVPLAIVGIGHIVRLIRDGQKWFVPLVLLAVGLIISTLGTLGYLYINYSIHGDALKFFEYQASNWHQKGSPFFDTPRYLIGYARTYIKNKDINTLVSLSIPSITAIFASLILVLSKAKKMPAHYTVYFLGYFAVAIGCTWLLSAVRYLSGALPISFAVAHCADKKWKMPLIFIILAALYIGYMYLYMLRRAVY